MKIKLLIAALAALLVLSSCAKGGAGNDTTAPEACEKPKDGVYYEYSSAYSDRVISSVTYEDGKEVYKSEYEYWPDGKLRTITGTAADGDSDIWNYNYSEDGGLYQMVRQYTEDGSSCRDDYRYTADGSLESLSVYVDDEYYGGECYSYNEKGDVTLEERLDANKDVIACKEYSFDEKGRTDGYKEYVYGSFNSYSKYEYNEKDLLLSVSVYSSADEPEKKIVNEYDSEDRIVKVLEYYGDGELLGYTECLYDKEGFNYRDIYYENGKPVYRYDYTKDGARIYSAYN